MSDFSDITGRNWERGVIKDAIWEYYGERLDIPNAVVEVTYRDNNVYEATVTYTDRRMGQIKAHYTAKLINGRAYFGDA